MYVPGFRASRTQSRVDIHMHALYLHMYAFSSWKSCANMGHIGAMPCLVACLLVELPVALRGKAETNPRHPLRLRRTSKRSMSRLNEPLHGQP